jgi:hypothetical protein
MTEGYTVATLIHLLQQVGNQQAIVYAYDADMGCDMPVTGFCTGGNMVILDTESEDREYD